MNRDELLPAYHALVRHVLKLAPGADALVELRARLFHGDANERLPPRAPGIKRLRAALRELEHGRTPASGLEQFADDLAFLWLFAPDGEPLEGTALERLLRDVLESGAKTRRTGRTLDSVVPIEHRARQKGFQE